jgi:hypothetical protein
MAKRHSVNVCLTPFFHGSSHDQRLGSLDANGAPEGFLKQISEQTDATLVPQKGVVTEMTQFGVFCHRF